MKQLSRNRRERSGVGFVVTWLGVAALLASPASAQVFAPGPSAPGLFNNVIDLPGGPGVGPSLSGGIGGIAGRTTQVNVNTGGTLISSFASPFTARLGAEINVDGGTIESHFEAIDGSEVNLLSGSVGANASVSSNRVDISGGTIGVGFNASNGAVVNVNGGDISGGFNTASGAVVNLSSGAIGDNFIAGDAVEVNVTGGSIGFGFFAEDGSVVNLSGGSVNVGLQARTGSTVRITGGTVSGDFRVFAGADVTISGGSVGNIFQALEGSVVDITGGTVGDFSEAGPGSIVNLSDGVVGDDFVVDGGTVNLTRGTVGDGLNILSGGTMSLSGGDVGDQVDVFAGGVLNVAAGSVGANATVRAAGVLNLSGGSIGGDFEVDANGVANLSGGSFDGSFRAFADSPSAGAEVNLFGSGFEIDGVPVAGLAVGVPVTITARGGALLSGELESGSAFDFRLNSAFAPGQDFFDADATVTVTLVSGLAGDYNNDSVVDAADYTMWRDSLGAPAGTLLNDVDGGAIDAAQYQTFAANFGSAAPVSSATLGATIPEPATVLLLSLACGGWLGAQRNGALSYPSLVTEAGESLDGE